MKRLWKFAAFAIMLAGTSTFAYQKGAAKRSSYTDEVYGFAIEAPRYPGVTSKTAATPLIVTGPPENGFAANLTVLIQSQATTAKDYTELSLGQFKEVGLKVNGHRELKVSGRDAVEFDYEGELKPGLNLRFLSLAVIDKDRVVLATTTTPSGAFAEVEAELRDCLASLRLK